MTTWTINGRLGMQGTVVIDGTALRWNITAPPSSVGNFTYGSSNMIPLVGDWDNNGTEGIGAYDPSTGAFHLKQAASAGVADITIGFGAPGLTPISWFDVTAGDRIGLIIGTDVYLDKGLTGGVAEITTTLSDISCSLPTVRQCTYTSPVLVANISGRLGMIGTVSKSSTSLIWDITAPPSSVGNFIYGTSSMIPLVGDWDNNGTEGIGVYDPSDGAFHLRQTASAGAADMVIGFGAPGLTPISWYDTYSLTSGRGDRIGIIQGSTVFLDTDFSGGIADITTTTSKMSCSSPSTVSQCKYLCGNIRIHVRNESLTFIGGYNFWLDGTNKGEITEGNRLFDSIDNGSHTCQIIKADSTVGACNYCSGSISCVPSTNSSNCSVPITIGSNGETAFWRFTILNPSVAMLTVTAITGTDTASIGTASATFTATVTNSGTASGTATVTFYTGVTTLATQTTGTIAPGATQNVAATVTISAWSVGTYSICAKTNYEQ